MLTIRLPLILMLFLAVAAGAPEASASAEAGSHPTVAELQRQLTEMRANMAKLQAEIERLQDRLEEVEARPAEAETPAIPADGLAALRAAAQTEVAAEEPVAEAAEEVTFTSGALGLQALNPEISVTGDFIASYRGGAGVTKHFDNTVRTLGLHVESYLDPYSRFKAAVPVSEDNASIGEAYFTRFGWQKNLNLTFGKFRQQFGVVNRWHKHGLDQVDFPLPLRQIFGPGGLNQTGASFEWQMPPLGSACQELTLQVTNGDNGRVFEQNTRNMPAFLAHYKNYRDLSKDTYLEFGLTGLAGRNDTWQVIGLGSEVVSQRCDLWTTVLGADLTLLWEPTGQMRYKNWVWRTEAYLLNKDISAPDASGTDAIRSWGAYSYFQKKLSRTHEAGIRVDYYEPDVKPYADLPGLSLAPLAVAESGAHQWMLAPYLTWYQSPWVHWRLEWNHLNNHRMGADEDAIFLQCIFAAGPHKHERY
jgi:uncharacterized coiled-coil protein SlyX